jgi:hypothetical protein
VADIYIEYLPDTGNPQFDLAAKRIVDLLRYYITDHDGKKVTNGDSHDHSGGDGAQIAYSSLSGLPVYVDRGDPSAYDVQLGALTTDATYRDLDLSSVVPVGGIAVHISAIFTDDAVGNILAFRENGNSNTYNILIGRTQVADVASYIDGIVRLDANRVIEYYASNTTWTSINILVRGWFI